MRAERARQGARLGSIIDRRVLRRSMASGIERGGELGGENGAAAIVKLTRRYCCLARRDVRRWFERAAAAIWTAFVRWGRTGHEAFFVGMRKKRRAEMPLSLSKSLNKLVGGEASSLPYALSSVFTLEMGFFAAKIVPLRPYALLVRLKIRQSARRRDTAVQREEMCGAGSSGQRRRSGRLS